MDAIRDAQKRGIVLGLKGVSQNGPVERMEIDELLLKKPDTFNLFLLALDELQNGQNTGDIMSFYQVAGIHGLPRSYWNGHKSPNKTSGSSWSGQGYCAHGRPTFPTWHRPYMAMMEQTLYAKMTDIAERFPEQSKAKYRAAVKDFRLPYFDYYRPRSRKTTRMPGITLPGGNRTSFDYDFSIPQIFTVESVMVRRTSDDTLHPIENPLNRFIFPKSGGFSAQDWTLVQGFSQQKTVRYPRNVNDTKGDPVAMNMILNREREANNTIILDMIQDYDSFASFSSDSLTPGNSGSLEDIHGNYHGLIGGIRGRMGHMSLVPIAAFDPVFWMHHCQIDRWFAIWQAAHPTRWFEGQFLEVVNGQRRRSQIGPLAKEDAVPFVHPSGAYWNGNTSQKTQDFGYVYREAVGTPQEVQDRFAKLYSWSVRSKTESGDYEPPPPEMEPLNVNTAQVFQYTAASVPNTLMSMAAVEAPQVVMQAMETTAKVASDVVGSSAPKAEPSPANVDPTPAAPGTRADGAAFTNFEPAAETEAPAKSIDESKYSRDWYVDNVVERLALNGSFTIYYFIGKFDSQNVDDYALQPTMAGLNHVFTSSKEACDNCGNQAETGHLISGTNPITPMLLDYVKIGELADITPANVVPFLVKNLKWRIVPESGQPENPRTVAGFKVGVSSKLTPRGGTAGNPIYEEYPQVVEQILANAD